MSESMAFPPWPQFSAETIEAVAEPLKTGKVNYWTGKRGMEFEEAFATWEGANYAISCTNGTAALHIAISSLGIGPSDEVIVPSYSFIASSFAIVQAGAIPVFCDVTRDHTLDPALIEKHITPKTKGIVVVHLYGVVADMAAIMTVARRHGLFVIEDCAQAVGGKFQDTKVGLIGDAGAFSFCQSKHFTTGGEGGMVVTNSEELAWECRSFRDHGYDVKQRLNLLALEEKLPYIHKKVGFNYRMTEIQSIIGLKELERFESWNRARRLSYAAMYDNAFTGLEGITAIPYNSRERQNAYWWYPMLIDTELLQLKADQFCVKLSEKGIPCYGIQWPEAYLEKAYKEKNGFGSVKFPFFSNEYTNPAQTDYSQVTCPVAHNLRDTTVSLFLHPSWEPEHIEYCIKGVKDVIKNNRD